MRSTDSLCQICGSQSAGLNGARFEVDESHEANVITVFIPRLKFFDLWMCRLSVGGTIPKVMNTTLKWLLSSTVT